MKTPNAGPLPAALRPVPCAGRGDDQGFVLLEIVMALGLFALVAVGMTQALDQIAQTSKLARQEAQLLRALDTALAQVTHLPEFTKARYDFPGTSDGIDAAASIEDGVRWIPCPAQTRDDVTCDSCRLCWDDAKLRAINAGVAFEAHGSAKRRAAAAVSACAE